MFSVFSGFSIYLTIPLLETLFHGPQAGCPRGARRRAASLGWLSAQRHRPAFVPGARVARRSGRVAPHHLRHRRGDVSPEEPLRLPPVEPDDVRRAGRHPRPAERPLPRTSTSLPLAYFSNERTGNLISRVMNDVPVINTGISATFFTPIREPLLVVGLPDDRRPISWKLTLISFIVFPFILTLAAFVGRRVHRESGLVQERIADLTSVLHETIIRREGGEGVRHGGVRERKVRARRSQALFRTVFRVTRIRNLASPLTRVPERVAGAVIIWYGGLQVLPGTALSARASSWASCSRSSSSCRRSRS